MYSTKFWDYADIEFGKQQKGRFKFRVTNDYRYRIDPADNPTKHIVSHFTIEKTSLEKILEELKELYLGKMGPVLHVRETDKPTSLKEHLQDYGFIQVASLDNMILDLHSDNAMNIIQSSSNKSTKYKIREVSNQVMADTSSNMKFFKLYKNGFADVPIDYERFTQDQKLLFQYANNGNYSTNFVVFEDKNPVSMAGIYELGSYNGKKIAYLGGAVTNENHRRQGLYRSIIKARLNSARNNDFDIVKVDANTGSSSPILAKYGFRNINHADLFINPNWFDIEI